MEEAPSYKYSKLIESLGLSINCPDGRCSKVSKTAYRLVRETFTDGQSFLPNIPYDKNRNRSRRMNDKGDKFRRESCGLSFFDSVDALNSMVKSIGGPSRVSKLLQYTHIAEGILHPNDGVATKPSNNHFVFFEYEGVNLETQFKVISPM